MIAAVQTCFRKYITFSGRAARAEFWYFILFLFLVSLLLSVIDITLFGQVNQFTGQYESNGIIPGLFMLACVCPWLAVTWRRMHDSGLAGYWPFVVWAGCTLGVFVLLFAAGGIAAATTGDAAGAALIVGILAFLAGFAMYPINIYLLCRSSTPGMNAYGAHPNDDPGTSLEEIFE
ncbi:MAG: DUF805 domain-containing protein [Pseudomonadota bacterium]